MFLHACALILEIWCESGIKFGSQCFKHYGNSAAAEEVAGAPPDRTQTLAIMRMIIKPRIAEFRRAAFSSGDDIICSYTGMCGAVAWHMLLQWSGQIQVRPVQPLLHAKAPLVYKSTQALEYFGMHYVVKRL